MYDIHCNPIPAADDGSDSFEESTDICCRQAIFTIFSGASGFAETTEKEPEIMAEFSPQADFQVEKSTNSFQNTESIEREVTFNV